MDRIILKESPKAILRLWKNEDIYGVEYAVHYKNPYNPNDTYDGYYTNSLEDAIAEYNKRTAE